MNLTGDVLSDLGVTKTVYSLCFPETDMILKEFLKKEEEIMQFYHNAYTKKQDLYHISFLEKYKQWTKNVLNIEWTGFKHQYPSNGSSESIREQICYLKSQGINNLYVFWGEYEGYEAIANAIGMNVIKVEWNDYKIKYKDNSVFFVSQPNSVNGNVWKNYDDFMIYTEQFKIPVYVDICYVGTVSDPEKINLFYSNIDGIFFSLSKAFGVYYHRIGGCFLKKSNPLLYGNMWFKNILSMKFGEMLMDNYDVLYFPRKYKNLKNKVIRDLEDKIFNITGNKTEIFSSDVLLLSTIHNIDPYYNQLNRFEGQKEIRLCLTPLMEKEFRR